MLERFKQIPIAKGNGLFLVAAIFILIILVATTVFAVYFITRVINLAFGQALPKPVPAIRFEIEAAEKLQKLNVAPPAVLPKPPSPSPTP